MSIMDATLAEFFREYEARTARALAGDFDVEATANAFAPTFIQADPNALACGQNDATLREAIPRGIGFYRRIGAREIAITAVATTALDDYHYSAKVDWRARYERCEGNRGTIDFTVVSLLRTVGGEPKIFGFLTGDEQQVYRDKGLIPSE